MNDNEIYTVKRRVDSLKSALYKAGQDITVRPHFDHLTTVVHLDIYAPSIYMTVVAPTTAEAWQAFEGYLIPFLRGVVRVLGDEPNDLVFFDDQTHSKQKNLVNVPKE